jgi:hypothetical protein
MCPRCGGPAATRRGGGNGAGRAGGGAGRRHRAGRGGLWTSWQAFSPSVTQPDRNPGRHPPRPRVAARPRGRRHEGLPLFWREDAPHARAEVAELHGADGHTHQLLDVDPDSLEYATNLAVAALIENDLEPRSPAPCGRPHLLQPQHLPASRIHALEHGRDGSLIGHATNANVVDLVEVTTRIRHAVGPSCVVREQEQALALEVQPTDRHDPRQVVRQQLVHRGTAMLVGRRGHPATGLVKHQVNLRFRTHRLAVHCDARAAHVNPLVRVAYRDAIDAHATLLDQRTRFGSRAPAQLRQRPRQAYLRARARTAAALAPIRTT